MNKLPFFKSLTSPYVRFIDQDLKVWDVAAGAMAAAPTWTDTDVALTDGTTTIGAWWTAIPALPNGLYYVPLYENASPASSDAVIGGKIIVVQDGGFIIQGDYLKNA